MEIHILLAGVEIGPFSEKQVRQHLADGLVSPSDPARIAGTPKWEAVDIVLAHLPHGKPTPAAPPPPPPPAPAQKAPRAILRTNSTPPPALKPPPKPLEEPSPPTPAKSIGAKEKAKEKEKKKPAPVNTTQSLKRKPIVLQPINPTPTAPLTETKVPTPVRAIKRSPDATPSLTSATSPTPPVAAPTPPKKMIAVKALLPAQSTSSLVLEKKTEKKSPPSLPVVKETPTPEPTSPAETYSLPLLPENEEKKNFAPVQLPKTLPRNFYYISGAGVIAILLICAGVYWWISGTGNQDKSDKVTAALSADDLILASHPTTADGFNKRGMVRQSRTDIDGAIADYDQAIALDPNNVLALYQRGLARETKSDWAGALTDFNQSLVLDPRHADTYSNRGFVKQNQGDLDGAITDYTQALFINPKIANAYYNRGLIKAQRGDMDGAIADYTQALQINPKSLVFYNRGLARSQRGDLDGAISDFNSTLDLDSKMAFAYYNRGNAKNAQGDLDGAIGDYTSALNLDPSIAAAYGFRGAARQTRGDFDGALDDYTQALKLNPKLTSIYYNRGLIREQKGDLDGAIDDTTQAITLNPKDAQSYCNRGLAKLGKGDLDGALVDLKTFCEMTPRDADADFARLYLWLISTRENPQGHADKDLANALTVEWNSPPDSLVSKIAKFLLGHASESDMLAIANDLTQDPTSRCKAWYFTGMKRLIAGQKDIAIDYLQKSLATGKADCCEFMFAQQELKNLGATPPPPAANP